MKRLYYIATLAIALFASLPIQAQEEAGNTQQQQQRRRGPEASRGAREEEKKENGMPELTVRAQDMNERMTQHIGNARWMRVIYRQIDLTKEQNAPLYYPTQPMNGQMNLFSIIFQLVCEGKLSAYEYLDGYEDFSDNRKLDLKVMLDRCRIFYEETPGKDNEPAGFVVNESDIPSGDVRSYYIKEAWYFDQNNSVFDVKTLAICPILTIVDDMGQNTMPMFWIPYENLRPYINKREQERIENQLITFEKSLYLQPDTAQLAADTKGKKSKSATVSARGRKTEAAKESKQKEVKIKAPKAQKSAPVRSVRRR